MSVVWESFKQTVEEVTMKKLKKSSITIVCYVFAAITLVYTIYAIGSAVTYLNSYFAAYGASIGANFKDAFSYIVGQAFMPLVLAVLLFMAGHINDAIRALNPDNFVEVEPKAEKVEATATEGKEVVVLEETAEEVQEPCEDVAANESVDVEEIVEAVAETETATAETVEAPEIPETEGK